MEEALIALVVFLRVAGVSKGDWSKVALRMMAGRQHNNKISDRIYGRDR